MTSEELRINYPNCAEKELVYLDRNGTPRLKESKFYEGLRYQEFLVFEFNYPYSSKPNSTKLEHVESFFNRFGNKT